MKRSNKILLFTLGALLGVGALSLALGRRVRDASARFGHPTPVLVVSVGGPGGARRLEIPRDVDRGPDAQEFDLPVADWRCRDRYVGEIRMAGADGPEVREGFEGKIECWDPADAASFVAVDFDCRAFDWSWLAALFGFPGFSDSVPAVRMRLLSGTPPQESAVEIEARCRYAKPVLASAGR